MDDMQDFGFIKLGNVREVTPFNDDGGPGFHCLLDMQDTAGNIESGVPYCVRPSDGEQTAQWVYAQCLAQWQNA